MTREEHLKLCKKCTKQKFDPKKGIICGLTNQMADFNETCENFEEDSSIAKEQKSIENEAIESIKQIPDHVIEKFKLQQNLTYGLIGGLQAAIIGALVWALITVVSEYQIGYMAIAVGLFVGVSVRYFGNGIDKVYGLIGAFMAFLGCFLGNFLSSIGFIATTQSLKYFEIFSLIDFSTFINIMVESFNPIDLLFYGLAIYEGYRFSFRKISVNDIESVSYKPYEISKTKSRLIFAFTLIIGFGIFGFLKSENGIRTYYYESGEKMSEGIMKYGKLEGAWTYWYESGKTQLTGFYLKDKEDSLWIYYDENGNKTHEGYFQNGMMNGIWTYYDENGSISYQGEYENDRINNKWTYWYPNKTKSQECNYLRDKLNGSWKVWYEDGSLQEEGAFKENMKVGNWKIWYPDGSINEELKYENDTVTIINIWDENGNHQVKNGDGIIYSYYENKNLSRKGSIKNGKPAGIWVSYYEDGSKLDEIEFKNNNPTYISYWDEQGNKTVSDGNGTYISYYENGSVFTEGNIKDGLKDGVWKTYYENGEISQTSMYVRSELNGLQQTWYPSGNINVEGEMQNNKRVGEWNWYFESGNPESNVYFVNDKKEGTQKFWNDYRKLLKEEIYENGELIEVKI